MYELPKVGTFCGQELQSEIASLKWIENREFYFCVFIATITISFHTALSVIQLI